MKARNILLIFTAWLLTGGAALADPFPSVDELTTICIATSHEGLCEATVDSFRRDWSNAKKGDYPAQRNVAFCLATGCDGAVVVDAVEACAWRMVIQGTNVRKEATERTAYTRECSLSNSMRREAIDRAEAMYKAIYRRELPLEKLLRD